MAKSKKVKKAKAGRKPVAKPAKRPQPAARLAKAAKAKVKASAKRKATVHPGVGAGRPSRVEILMGDELRKLRVATVAMTEAICHVYNDGKPDAKCINPRMFLDAATKRLSTEDITPPLSPAAKPKDVAVEVMEMAQKSAATIGKAHDKVTATNESAKVQPAAEPKLAPPATAPEIVVEATQPIAPTSPAPWMAPAGA